MLNLFALEINAVTHCNLACVGCSHSSPVSPVSYADPTVVFNDLSNLSSVVNVTEVRILGGEPLLHPELPDLMRSIKQSEIGGITRVYTNGIRLNHDSLCWLEDADEVQLSIYPGAKLDQPSLARLARACTAANVQLIPKKFHSFRLSRPIRKLSEDEIVTVYETCQMAHSRSCHTVQSGRVYICPPSAPTTIGGGNDESCPIEPLETLEKRLEAFLSDKTPLRSCSTCLGTVGTRIQHRQGNAKTWLELTSRGEIDWDQVAILRRNPNADNGCCEIETL